MKLQGPFCEMLFFYLRTWFVWVLARLELGSSAGLLPAVRWAGDDRGMEQGQGAPRGGGHRGKGRPAVLTGAWPKLQWWNSTVSYGNSGLSSGMRGMGSGGDELSI